MGNEQPHIVGFRVLEQFLAIRIVKTRLRMADVSQKMGIGVTALASLWRYKHCQKYVDCAPFEPQPDTSFGAQVQLDAVEESGGHSSEESHKGRLPAQHLPLDGTNANGSKGRGGDAAESTRTAAIVCEAGVHEHNFKLTGVGGSLWLGIAGRYSAGICGCFHRNAH